MDHLSRLLVDAQSGNVDALDRFIAETQPDVWRLCRYLGDERDADDLAQETYERAIKSIARYRGDGPARAWLLTIARHVCSDHVRRSQRRRRRDAAAIADADIDAYSVTDGTLGIALDELVGSLDPDRRAAFVLTQVLGLYYDEAAEILGCPIGTIRSRVARARIDLSTMLQRAADDATNTRDTGTRSA